MTTPAGVFTLKTGSKAVFALVKLELGTPAAAYPYLRPVVGARIVGYAHTAGPAVKARARRLGALLLPIVGGKVTVTL